MKIENKLDEMVEILDHLHQYVPTKEVTATVSVEGIQPPPSVRYTSLHPILLGGDQLTAARIRGAKMMRTGSEHDVGKLQGIIPVVEDWHAKVCLLEVSPVVFCVYSVTMFHLALMYILIFS